MSTRKPINWLNVAVGMLGALVIAVVLMPASTGGPERGTGRWLCSSTLRQIHIAIQMYKQDELVYPPAQATDLASSVEPFHMSPKPAYGWTYAISSYVRNSQIYHCPDEGNAHESADAAKTGFTDYWYNANLSGKNSKFKFKYTDKTILLGEGNDGSDRTDGRYAYRSLPTAWRTDQNSPSFRHDKGANYLLLDGSVELLKPEQIKDKRKTAKDYSLQVQ